MTNADLKAMVAALGDRLAIIRCDNGENLMLGYPSNKQDIDDKGNPIWKTDSEGNKFPSTVKSIEPADIQYHKFGEEEFFSTSHVYTSQKPFCKYRIFHRTECIQAVIAMEPGFEDYRIDVMGTVR